MVVGVHVWLVGRRQPGAAAGAGFGIDLEHVVGIGFEVARYARPALAWRLRAFGAIGFLAARGRQRGVVRRLGRDVQLGFECRDTGGQRRVLLDESQHQCNQLRLVEFAKRLRCHPEFESAHANQIKPSRPSQSVAPNADRG
jgi:hypothetical protein